MTRGRQGDAVVYLFPGYRVRSQGMKEVRKALDRSTRWPTTFRLVLLKTGLILIGKLCPRTMFQLIFCPFFLAHLLSIIKNRVSCRRLACESILVDLVPQGEGFGHVDASRESTSIFFASKSKLLE